ncbi:hypothetical protein CANARDRAFT_5509 [[Candida] arabinofermentans NRRL YB-2248]|uniref:Ubiquitin carboxyl-terminal hydrolase n=1 Tax=[Candida] arabinofermentans NRRL YB-2248 TaxID=983967 RepID=A0A1E4T8Y1_9ASCO|nr:hypothetical protein CANARDRAFT_5509 [[Candida] arabinofermentans NRRL YB-2248]
MAEQEDIKDFGSVIPLESNPEIFSDFAKKLGLSPLISFFDIYSITDPDLISFLSRPISSIILLFPITEAYEKQKSIEESTRDLEKDDNFQNIIWFKQLLRNGCGLYGLLHTLCNLPSGLIVNQSKVWEFIESLKNLKDVKNYNNYREKTEMISNLSLSLYENFSKQGQTEAPPAEADTDLHFICFTKGKNGHIFELDGRRNGPVDLGLSTGDADVLDSDIVTDRIKLYMDLAAGANELNFAMMGLGPSFD